MVKHISEWSKDGKIQWLREYNPMKHERKILASYLWAVYRDKKEKIDYYESFGRSPKHIIWNLLEWQRAEKLGFEMKPFDENGWLHFKEKLIKTYEFEGYNRIDIYQTPSGMYSFGIVWTNRNGGGCTARGVYGDHYSLFERCLTKGCDYFLDKSDIPSVRKQIKELLHGLTAPKQLSLF